MAEKTVAVFGKRIRQQKQRIKPAPRSAIAQKNATI
jgi:hypothetical protein